MITTITTTEAEDDAILAFTARAAVATGGKPETVAEFIARAARQQIAHAVGDTNERIAAEKGDAYLKLSATDRAAVDAILSRTGVQILQR